MLYVFYLREIIKSHSNHTYTFMCLFLVDQLLHPVGCVSVIIILYSSSLLLLTNIFLTKFRNMFAVFLQCFVVSFNSNAEYSDCIERIVQLHCSALRTKPILSERSTRQSSLHESKIHAVSLFCHQCFDKTGVARDHFNILPVNLISINKCEWSYCWIVIDT